MNPRLLLRLWRERWDKSVGNTLATPYLQGQINLWGNRLTRLSVWSLPGVAILTSLLCLLLFVFLLTIRFTLNGQIVFSVFLVCIGLYVSRYAGRFVTLVLLGLALIVSMRYLYWRFGATLVPDTNSDFVLGFCLCVAEVHLWLLISLKSIQAIWPLKQPHIPLPSESAKWPTVDIFIPCDDQPPAAIRSAALAALALDWPKNKLRTYLLDDSPKDDIKALADSIGATYLTYPDNSDGKVGNVNHALPGTEGELIAILDCDRPLDADFLKMTVGWFVQDTKLGMLLTPQHFLAPAPSERCLEILSGSDFARSGAILRRSMLVEVGGVETQAVTKQANTALKLQARGHRAAYFGFANEASHHVTEGPRLRVNRRAESAPVIFQVTGSLGDKSLLWRQRLAFLRAMLQFYYPVPRLIFFSAPLAFLLADVQLIQTSAELFAAYALPHLIQGHIARQRMRGDYRFTVGADVRETALAWYLLLATTLTLIRTEFSRYRNPFKIGNVKKEAALDWKLALPYVIIFTFSLMGVIVGTNRLRLPNTQEQEIVVILFLLWAVYNLMILAAMLAVAQESRDVRQHIRLLTQLPAMIKLPSGRTVSCMTENFPEIALALKLPAPMTIENGLTVGISIFYGNREFSFPAQVALEQDSVLRATIDGPAQNVYGALSVAAYSRGQDWPKWLPAQDADQPIPLWIPRAFTVMRSAVLGFVADFGKFARWPRFGSWMQIWKKKK